jgi:hypothetical protein
MARQQLIVNINIVRRFGYPAWRFPNEGLAVLRCPKSEQPQRRVAINPDITFGDCHIGQE